MPHDSISQYLLGVRVKTAQRLHHVEGSAKSGHVKMGVFGASWRCLSSTYPLQFYINYDHGFRTTAMYYATTTIYALYAHMYICLYVLSYVYISIFLSFFVFSCMAFIYKCFLEATTDLNT